MTLNVTTARIIIVLRTRRRVRHHNNAPRDVSYRHDRLTTRILATPLAADRICDLAATTTARRHAAMLFLRLPTRSTVSRRTYRVFAAYRCLLLLLPAYSSPRAHPLPYYCTYFRRLTILTGLLPPLPLFRACLLPRVILAYWYDSPCLSRLADMQPMTDRAAGPRLFFSVTDNAHLVRDIW